MVLIAMMVSIVTFLMPKQHEATGVLSCGEMSVQFKSCVSWRKPFASPQLTDAGVDPML